MFAHLTASASQTDGASQILNVCVSLTIGDRWFFLSFYISHVL